MAEPAPAVSALVRVRRRAARRRRAPASPRLDAELLLAGALGTDRTGILAHPDAPWATARAATFEALVARRERGEPVAYIRGFREFHGLAIARTRAR